MIFILNKQEKVINILKNSGGANGAPPFFDDVYSQDLATGAETFSFSTIALQSFLYCAIIKLLSAKGELL